jgi:hypothetical protein
MLVLAPNPSNLQSVRTDAAAAIGIDTNPAALASVPTDGIGLSTDYLNHYSEILMLIEIASFDASIVDDICVWQQIGYQEYFRKSSLRRAASALSAYERLTPESRLAFEQIVQALDKLTLGAILALRPPCHPRNVVLIGDVIGPAIRRLIDRAAAFLNSGGKGLWEACEADHAQRMTDWLLAKSA